MQCLCVITVAPLSLLLLHQLAVVVAATVVQLEPFLDSTLLAALLEGPGKRGLLATACGCFLA